jgi:predicted nucleotidyltransferase/predicted XRE-type DNA-binding protein
MTTAAAELREQAQEADVLYERSRTLLVTAVRAGVRAGLSQVEIAKAIGRSQPEVSRLLHFQGQSPLGMKLRKNRATVIKIAKEFGARDLRVFGSLATGRDNERSDIDLLATFEPGIDLFDMVQLEFALSELLGVDVDVVPENSLRPFLKERVLSEAVPL